MKYIIMIYDSIRKYKSLSFFLILFVSLSCEKDNEEIYYTLNGTQYPKGFKVIDLTSIDDCSLPSCSELRITRLILKDVIATFRTDSILNVSFTFDSKIQFHICNIEFINNDLGIKDGDIVVFSGDAKDACGYLIPSFPFEEKYFIIISKIALL